MDLNQVFTSDSRLSAKCVQQPVSGSAREATAVMKCVMFGWKFYSQTQLPSWLRAFSPPRWRRQRRTEAWQSVLSSGWRLTPPAKSCGVVTKAANISSECHKLGKNCVFPHEPALSHAIPPTVHLLCPSSSLTPLVPSQICVSEAEKTRFSRLDASADRRNKVKWGIEAKGGLMRKEWQSVSSIILSILAVHHDAGVTRPWLGRRSDGRVPRVEQVNQVPSALPILPPSRLTLPVAACFVGPSIASSRFYFRPSDSSWHSGETFF